ncbi:EAL domain-containing protein [Maricaulis maris]|uniref:EAL domain-containing protein (Putative c-di-GMP-specific phosphodiesterase class I) n=1 Tax=Maricaulis maris TaxID=74318 RepID=A0A495D1B4_9PROT|nr:EAL domain-containing protein [Maricaulis maris]RKQ95276.1 EAL domain-containing protein (putative c-di-GMP-specific phosphodiesterase class I) [Maricaulis maris]
MSLVEQRNRFLSFAFAAADILIETDGKGRVTYAAGAVAALGEPQLNGTGEDLAKRFDRTSRPIFQATMHRLKPGRRLGPVRIAVGGRECRLSGWMLGEDDRIRWSLSYEAMHAPDELDPQAFERCAERAIEKARSAGVNMAMSVLRIDAGDALDRLIGDARAAAVYQSVAASCTLAVGDDGVARQVDEERTALIHDRNVDLENLRTEVKASLADAGLPDAEVVIESVADAPSIEPGIAIQAFLYAINEAAQSDKALDIVSLQEVAEGMMRENERRMTELRTTIAGRVIEPHAQPVVELETGKVHHYELLLRLPDGKPVQDSVGFAESTGLIYEIDFAMTEIAAAFLREDYDRPALAVNLSGKSLTNMAWGKRFLALLSDLRIDRSRLSFELTETATVSNIKAANAVIQKIRERGHQVCLDDFGAGSAGFHYLRDFPADVVKIDGSYIKQFEHSKRDATLLKGMINICRSLGAATVAEMIETEAQATTLKGFGVTYGQGYYFGKPVPLSSLKDPKKNASRAA